VGISKPSDFASRAASIDYCGLLGEQSTGTKISATAKHGAGLPSE
jgi:hypothetical protein